MFCLFLLYYVCAKYNKPVTVQYYIADCVSGQPRLTVLDLRLPSRNSLVYGGLTVLHRMLFTLLLQAHSSRWRHLRYSVFHLILDRAARLERAPPRSPGPQWRKRCSPVSWGPEWG